MRRILSAPCLATLLIVAIVANTNAQVIIRFQICLQIRQFPAAKKFPLHWCWCRFEGQQRERIVQRVFDGFLCDGKRAGWACELAGVERPVVAKRWHMPPGAPSADGVVARQL